MTAIPYCGLAPLPGGASWNLDPVLIACLALLCGTQFWVVRGEPSWRKAACAAGWCVAALALVSPLCNLSVALFSARVGQHMVLDLVAAPLLAVALPPGRAAGSRAIWASSIAFAVALWAWHMPALYDETFRSTVVYWAMHLTLFGAAVWFWAALLRGHAHAFAALGASFLTGLHMSLLGALLTFAARPWFAVHFGTTSPWGYTPLEDQQLGGLLMWIPSGVLLTAYAVLLLGWEIAQSSRGTQPGWEKA